MTSEPDSTPRRRPPTIDLTATEVGAEKPAATPQPDAGKPTAEKAASSAIDRLTQRVIAALVGAVAMAAIFAGLWLAGDLATRTPAAPPGAPGPQPTAIDQLSARLDKIQDAFHAPQPDSALASRITMAEAATKSLKDSLAALTNRVDEVAAAAQSATGKAKDASTAADQAESAARAAVQRGDLDALAGRIAALEGTVKTLSANAASRPSSADDGAARLTATAAALRIAVERGVPYQAELAAVKSLGVGQDATAPLEQFATSGVPSAAALAHELSTLMPAVLRASGDLPTDASLLGRLEASARQLVRITPANAPPSNDPSSVNARIDADAARADIGAALTDISALPDSAKSLAAAWVQKVNARDAAIAASRQIAADALAALGKPASQ
jgi:hypothetical protein